MKVTFLGGPGAGDHDVPLPLPERAFVEVPEEPERWVPWETPAATSPRPVTVAYRLVPASFDRWRGDRPAHYVLEEPA